jgi:hypothetical protein
MILMATWRNDTEYRAVAIAGDLDDDDDVQVRLHSRSARSE